MTLRLASLVVLAILAVVGVVMVITGSLQAWELVCFAVLLILAIVFERSTYQRTPPANRNLQFTGEVFEDPVSKKTVRVMYDPETGERYYDDTDSDKAPHSGSD